HSGKDGILTWSLYTGPDSMQPGSLGIPEPTGVQHDSSILAELDVLFVPALAIDGSGMRLGKGAGYYDRALGALASRPRVIAVVYAEEVIDFVPHDELDQPADSVITDYYFTCPHAYPERSGSVTQSQDSTPSAPSSS